MTQLASIPFPTLHRALPTPADVRRAAIGLGLGAYHDGRFGEAFLRLVSMADPHENPDPASRAELLSLAALACIHLDDAHGAAAAFEAARAAAWESGWTTAKARVADQAAWAVMLVRGRAGRPWDALRDTLEHVRLC